jgi:hypothetical protein
MSLKRSHSSGKSSFGSGGDAGAKVDRQELFDELKRLAAANEAFTPVDVSLAIGAGEPQVSKALLGLAAEGYLEKVEVGKYRATGVADLSQAEFLKALPAPRGSIRQRDLSRFRASSRTGDTMGRRLLTAIAERPPPRRSRSTGSIPGRPRRRAKPGARGARRARPFGAAPRLQHRQPQRRRERSRARVGGARVPARVGRRPLRPWRQRWSRGLRAQGPSPQGDWTYPLALAPGGSR